MPYGRISSVETKADHAARFVVNTPSTSAPGTIAPGSVVMEVSPLIRVLAMREQRQPEHQGMLLGTVRMTRTHEIY